MRISLLLIVMMIVGSCEKNSPNETIIPLTTNPIIGRWQLTENYISSGGDAVWLPVENGDIFNFAIDGTFVQTNTFDNEFDKSGSYSVVEDSLRLDFIRNGEEKWQTFNIHLQDDTMSMVPSGPTVCIEACIYKYVRLK